MNKRNIFVLFLALLAGSLQAGRNKYTDDIDPAAGAIVAGGAVLGAFGAYKLYKWFTYKDARKLASKARAFMEVCKAQYGDSIEIINRKLSLSAQKNGNVRYVDEKVLYQLSANIKDYRDINSLYSALKDLMDCKYKIEKKRNDVLNGYDEDNTFDKHYIDKLLIEIDVLLTSMQFLNSFVKEHKGYFENLTLGKKLADSDYAKEMVLLNSGRYDIQYQLICCARSRFNSKNIVYPLLAFADEVRDDLNRLVKTKKSLAYNYPNLLASASSLESQLRRIVEIIEASQEYAQEKIARREEELKRERLRIEQEKADAEHRKARAEERKARAEEERVRAEWAKALQQQNPTVVVIQQ